MPRKNMHVPRFESGSPQPRPKLFDDLDRSAIGPQVLIYVLEIFSKGSLKS